MLNTRRDLFGVAELCAIDDLVRIEEHQIRNRTGADFAAIGKTENPCRGIV